MTLKDTKLGAKAVGAGLLAWALVGLGCSDGGGTTAGAGGTGAGGDPTTTSASGGMGGMSGTGGGSGNCKADGHPIALNSTTVSAAVTPCADFNLALGTVTVFSEQNTTISIKNNSADAVTINDIAIAHDASLMVQDEEFRYQDASFKIATFKETSIPVKGSFDHSFRCHPVASGPRKAKITVTYNGSSKFEYTAICNGSPGLAFATNPGGVKQYLLGSSDSSNEELFGTMVADAEGNTYVVGNYDKSADDTLLLARINKDGKLAWGKSLDGEFFVKVVAPNDDSTGGTDGSLTMGKDGKLYLVARYATVSQDNVFAAYVAKIEPATGAPIWQKFYALASNPTMANVSAEPFAIDASDTSRVFVTGYTPGGIFALALNASDGGLIFQKKIDVNKVGSVDVSYAVRYDGKGGLFLGGKTSSTCFLLKMTGANGSTPTLAWTEKIDVSFGGRTLSLDVDPTGNVYAGLLGPGASAVFAVGSFDTDGKTRWIHAYNGSAGNKSNKVDGVRFVNGSVWAYGKTAPPNFDGQQGDAWLLKLNPADGAITKSAFYFNGKGSDELTEHRVKGLAVVNGELLLGLGAYTATMNGKRYWGYWYEGFAAPGDFSSPPPVTDATPTVTDLTGTLTHTKPAITYADLPNGVVLQPAADKTNGVPPDGDFMVIRMPSL